MKYRFPLKVSHPSFSINEYTSKLPLDEEESSFDKILDDLFKIEEENIRKMEHEVPNRCDNITDYEDSDQEDGGLPDLPNFSATNEFASVCKQGKDNIDVNTAQELEEVQVEDVEIDEDYDIDHSNTKESIQWSHAHDPFLVVLELDVQSSFLLRTIPSSISNEATKWFKRLVAYAKCNHDSYETIQGDWMLLVEELDVGDSEHGLEHAVSSLYRANPGEKYASYTPYIRRIEFTPATRAPRVIMAMDSEKDKTINMVNYKGYRKSPYEKMERWMDNEISFPSVSRYQLVNSPIVLEAYIEGFQVRWDIHGWRKLVRSYVRALLQEP
ncbi:hypothetical protein Tco_0591662 [Tanacetum coccineum]